MENNKQDSLNGRKEKYKRYMENIRLIDNYQPNGGVDDIRIIYDRVNDKICFETPSLYEFVDLGLPSGTKWATCNVGATKPEDYGLFFAWGETQGYTRNYR